MPSKYGFETAEERSQKERERQAALQHEYESEANQPDALTTTARRIAPVITDILEDYEKAHGSSNPIAIEEAADSWSSPSLTVSLEQGVTRSGDKFLYLNVTYFHGAAQIDRLASVLRDQTGIQNIALMQLSQATPLQAIEAEPVSIDRYD